MLTRDSLILWAGILAGLVLYLADNKPPTQWGYYEWLAFAGYVLSVISAKLSGSVLAGNNTAPAKTQTIFGGLVKLTKE